MTVSQMLNILQVLGILHVLVSFHVAAQWGLGSSVNPCKAAICH